MRVATPGVSEARAGELAGAFSLRQHQLVHTLPQPCALSHLISQHPACPCAPYAPAYFEAAAAAVAAAAAAPPSAPAPTPASASVPCPAAPVRVWTLGCRVEGVELRVWGAGWKV
eukprot:2401023-Rhodomonas_salina.1